jgi:hypothetical protein
MNDRTHQAIMNPQVGDRFTEMCTFWVYVVNVCGNIVTTMEANGPCTFPDNGKVRVMTVDEFRERLSYSGHNGHYWARLIDRGNNVGGWLDSVREIHRDHRG